MKTLVKPVTRLKTFRISDRTSYSIEKGKISIILIDSKFYQKLFAVLISFSTILIFPDTPKELESVCKRYHSNKICNVL